MPPADRRNAILGYLDRVGSCTYGELAERLAVSEMTIRRDVDSLVARREAIKTLGGVQTAHAAEHLYESPIRERLPVNRQQKELIAREAWRRIKPHQTVFLDGSTTCLLLARRLARDSRRLTVVTNSALVCLEFGRNVESPDNVVMLGGQFDPASACFVGPSAEESAGRFFVDVALFSTKGFLPNEGTFESSIATIRIKQIIAEQAARVMLLVDHSKFGNRALCKALDVAQIHEVITDPVTAAEHISHLKQRGVEVGGDREISSASEVAVDAP